MASYTIRQATDSDLDRLVELSLALREHVEASNPRLWRLAPEGVARLRQEIEETLSNPDALLLVAVGPDDRPLGMATGQIRTRPGHVPSLSGYIARVFVEPACRGQGLASALVEGLCTFFAERDVQDLSLGWVLGNREAEDYWTGLGFLPIIVLADATRHDVEAKLAAIRSRRSTDGSL